MTERREDARVSGAVVRRISALVRPGQWVLLLDLSPSGALVAGRRPLRPGARVDVYFHADDGRAAVQAWVVRCSVAAMDADRVVYHAGLQFAERAEWVGERTSRTGSLVPAQSEAETEHGHSIPSHVHQGGHGQSRGSD
jgi:hypothetical protein